jgi:hypothetical protein
MFYHHSRAVVSRLFPEMAYAPREIDILTDHITSFSLAALKHFGKLRQGRKGRR